MNILGISAFYHDSAVALIRDGHIVAAAQEERFTRKKHDRKVIPFDPWSECPVCQQVSWSKYLVKRDRLHPQKGEKEYNLYRCNTCHRVKTLPEPP